MCVVFSVTSFGIGKYDCVMNAKEIFNFLLPTNNSVTSGYFLVMIISAIISNTNKNFHSFPFLDCNFQYFCRHLSYPWRIESL